MKGWVAALAAAVLIGGGASSASAVNLTFTWRAPCTNANPDSGCAWVGVDTLRDLALIRFRLVRFRDLSDTLVLDVPAGGRECDTMAVTFDVEPGTMGVAEARAVDFSAHESCPQAYVFAIEARDVFTGLDGEYYDNVDLTGFKFTRVDPNIAFDWDYASPDPRLGADTFSIRWTGYLTAAVTGTYQFFTRIEDGVKLWVGPTWVISDWGVQPEHESSGYANLVGGTRYAFRMEYTANNGTAICELRWLPPGGVKAIVPAEAFTR